MGNERGLPPVSDDGEPAPLRSDRDRASRARQEVGSFLREARRSQRLTQSQLSRLTESSPWRISRAGISAIERGENFPGLEAMLALQRVLHLDLRELIERARLKSFATGPDVSDEELDDVGLERRASALFWDGRYREALALYDRLMERLVPGPRPSTSELRHRVATMEVRRAACLRRAGALTVAIDCAENAVALAPENSEPLAEAYVMLATLRTDSGNLPLARDAARQAIKLCSDPGAAASVPRLAGWAHIVRGHVEFAAGRHGSALADFLRAEELAREASDTTHLTHIEGNVGACHRALGRGDEAADWLRRAIRRASEQSQPALEASWRVELGRVELDGGRLAEAERLADAALRLAGERDHALTMFRAEWLLHLVVRATDPGDPDRRRLERLRRLYRRVSNHRGVEEIEAFRESVLDET